MDLVRGAGTPTPPVDYDAKIAAAGGDDVPLVEASEVNLRELLALGDTGLDLARVLQIHLLLPKDQRVRIGRWVAEGLSLDLVR